MTFKEYFSLMDSKAKRKFASVVEAVPDYLRQVAQGHATASPKLAIRIEKETHGLVNRNALRPDIFGE